MHDIVYMYVQILYMYIFMSVHIHTYICGDIKCFAKFYVGKITWRLKLIGQPT